MTGGPAAARARRPVMPAPGFADEAALASAWAAAPAGILRLADGRALRVVFPGVPGDGSGPDFRDAILDVEGDLVRGDVEVHLRHSGWFAHGHDRDPAYAGVALHVAGENDLPLAATPHAGGRRVPLLVLGPPPEPGAGFVPPCAFARAAGLDVAGRLRGMGLRRLRMKANRAALLAAGRTPATCCWRWRPARCSGQRTALRRTRRRSSGSPRCWRKPAGWPANGGGWRSRRRCSARCRRAGRARVADAFGRRRPRESGWGAWHT
ncbi:DUF2851 family protein [Tepidiforma flava]|uniref:DUF2851 family protein n=1 Tax=Tepidiforma flava TaxID=3004094 RepID=A0ABY7M8R0_9CHLR|nr:DUF2851 family protein [Tepidiforma flava]WBL36899.1 DUF2851 family protein [Tepidiforma flava]